MIKDVLRFLWRRDEETAADLIMLIVESMPPLWARDIGGVMVRHSQNPQQYVEDTAGLLRVLYWVSRVLWWRDCEQVAVFSLIRFLSLGECGRVGSRLQCSYYIRRP